MGDVTEEVVALLLAAQQGNKDALDSLDEGKAQNYANFVSILGGIMADESKHYNVRSLAALHLKNAFVSDNSEVQEYMIELYDNLSLDAKAEVKNLAFASFSAPEDVVRRSAAQVISAVAQIELPRGQGLDVIPALAEEVTSTSDNLRKDGALSALGYICQQVTRTNALEDQANLILEAVMTGFRPEELDLNLRAVACRALNNSLGFLAGNMSVKQERRSIFDSYLDACVCEGSKKLRLLAYKGLVEVVDRYYEYLGDIMESLRERSFWTVANDEDEVAKLAIQIWSSIAEVEAKLKEEIFEGTTDSVCHHFTHRVLDKLIPLCCEMLTHQDEDQNEDSWNAAAAASTCLGLCAVCETDDVVPFVMEFVSQHHDSSDWHYKDAAFMAFGSIMEGPDEALDEYMVDGISQLLPLMNDEMPLLRDTSTWALGRICEHQPDYVFDKPEILHSVVNALGAALTDEPPVAAHACFGIHNLARFLEEEAEEKTNALSEYMVDLYTALWAVIGRSDSNENHLLTAAYEALGQVVSATAMDQLENTATLVPMLLSNLSDMIRVETDDPDVRSRLLESELLVCTCLYHCTQRLGVRMVKFSNDLMDILNGIFDQDNQQIFEEVMMICGALANAIGLNFENYVNEFLPHLEKGLRAVAVPSVVIISLGALSDMSRALGRSLKPILSDIMGILWEIFHEPTLDKNVHPHILATFGDVACAVEGDFLESLEGVMGLIYEAMEVQPADDSDDEIDYVNLVRQNVLESCSSILQGLKNDPDTFMDHAVRIMGLLQQISEDPNRDDEVIRAAVSFVGDVVNVYGVTAREGVDVEYVSNLVSDALMSNDKETKKQGKWAMAIIKKILN